MILEGKRDEAVPILLDAQVALAERAPVHLYLALAYFSSYLKGGEQSAAIAERARVSLREALRLSPSISADPNSFSPRFRSFFEEVRATRP